MDISIAADAHPCKDGMFTHMRSAISAIRKIIRSLIKQARLPCLIAPTIYLLSRQPVTFLSHPILQKAQHWSLSSQPLRLDDRWRVPGRRNFRAAYCCLPDVFKEEAKFSRARLKSFLSHCQRGPTRFEAVQIFYQFHHCWGASLQVLFVNTALEAVWLQC